VFRHAIDEPERVDVTDAVELQERPSMTDGLTRGAATV
jgi:hypothetical protein